MKTSRNMFCQSSLSRPIDQGDVGLPISDNQVEAVDNVTPQPTRYVHTYIASEVGCGLVLLHICTVPTLLVIVNCRDAGIPAHNFKVLKEPEYTYGTYIQRPKEQRG